MISLKLYNQLEDRGCYFPYITDEKTEAQRRKNMMSKTLWTRKDLPDSQQNYKYSIDILVKL